MRYRPPMPSIHTDLNLLLWRRRTLGRHDDQDPIFEARLDCVLVDAHWETECTVEFPDRALGDPVPGSALSLCLAGGSPFLFVSLLGHFRAAFDEPGWWCT